MNPYHDALDHVCRLAAQGVLRLDTVQITEEQLQRGFHRPSGRIKDLLGEQATLALPAVEDWLNKVTHSFRRDKNRLYGDTAFAFIGFADFEEALHQLHQPNIEQVCLAPLPPPIQVPKYLFILTRLRGPLTDEQATVPTIEEQMHAALQRLSINTKETP